MALVKMNKFFLGQLGRQLETGSLITPYTVSISINNFLKN